MSTLVVTMQTVRIGQAVRDRAAPYAEGNVHEVSSVAISVMYPSGIEVIGEPAHWTHIIPPYPDLGTGADGRERRARWREFYGHLPGAESMETAPTDVRQHLDVAEARRFAREAKERADKTTPGPWYLDEDGEVRGAFCPIGQGPANIGSLDFGANDEAFVLGARTDVPALAALVQQMAGEIERLTAKIVDVLARNAKLVNQRDKAREEAVRLGVGWSKAQDEIERIRADVAELQRDERAVLNQLKSSLRGPSHTGTTSPFAEHAGRRVRRIMDGRTGIIALFGPDQVPHILLEGSGKNGFEGPALPADPAVWYLVSDIEPVPLSEVPSRNEAQEAVRRLRVDLDKFTSDLRGLAARESQSVKDRAPEQPICLCPASSEYDPPCPRHGILGIGVTGRP